MDEAVISTAFNMGVISACSLPLGALTVLYWKPGDRVAAALVAFGGGALLAALPLTSLPRPSSAATMPGWQVAAWPACLLFVALNEIINDYGGFLRKASTTICHLRRQEPRRFTCILSNLQRVDIFQNLPPEDFKRAAAGAMPFRPGQFSGAPGLHSIYQSSLYL